MCTQLKILAADFNWKSSEVLRLAEVCPLLEDVSLPFVEASDTLLCQIAKLLPNLTAIGLNCENISSPLSDNSLKSFGNYCPKISKFNVASHGFTKQGLIRFAEKCTEQVNIGTLSRSKRFDHEVFAEYVKHCPNLSRLIFRHLDGKKKNSISEHAWKKPMLQLKKLISLKLNRCVFDEQTFLQPLFRTRGSDIEAIYFYNCSFSGKALQTLAQQALRLTSLHFINSSVNAESITAFSKALSFNNCLEQMAIVACKKVGGIDETSEKLHPSKLLIFFLSFSKDF
jgi:hypothetical protein